MVSTHEVIIRNGLPPALVDDPFLSQLLAWAKQPCAWAREERHYFATSPNIHQEIFSGDRQEVG
jgi:hypothetical protein